MCGIAGIIRFDRQAVDEARLNYSSAVLRLRGPDDAGFWSDDRAHLLHRRLSIIDLSAGGHQPMLSGDKRYVIAFNGEIYNYAELRVELSVDGMPWASKSDTEVILRAYSKWGTDCLTRFRGMFAIAIWDREVGSIFIARDRLGVKPLYVYHQGNVLAFASRPNALIPLLGGFKPDFDLQGLRYFLDVGYFPGEFTQYQGIRKVLAGTYMQISEHSTKTDRYWSLPAPANEQQSNGRSENSLLNELDKKVQSAVLSRLVADVPVGSFLSGGIDSTLVTAVAARHAGTTLNTFTVGFDEAEHDESSHALEIAKYLGTHHYTFTLKVNDLLELLPVFFQNYDEPFFDSAAFPTLAVSRLASQYVKVSMSGDGGDELFGGYHYYKIVARLAKLYKLPKWLRLQTAAILRIPNAHSLELLAGAISLPSVHHVFPYSRSIIKDYSSILNQDILTSTKSFQQYYLDYLQQDHFGSYSPAEHAMRFDTMVTLPDDYLQKLDVASMTYSLEARDPLLDQELVEWAASLPLKWKLRGNNGKYLLRELAYRYVPKQLLDRPKHGFTVPIDQWLRGPLSAWAAERLNDSKVFTRLPLQQDVLLKLFEVHSSGKRNVAPLLWAALVMIEFTSQADQQTKFLKGSTF